MRLEEDENTIPFIYLQSTNSYGRLLNFFEKQYLYQRALGASEKYITFYQRYLDNLKKLDFLSTWLKTFQKDIHFSINIQISENISSFI